MHSLKSHLSKLYGELITSQVRIFERTSIRRSKLINNLAFLKRCRDSNIIPNGLQLRDPIRSRRSDHILRASSLSLLRLQIASTRSQLAAVDKQIASTRQNLYNTCQPGDFTKIQALTKSSSDHVYKTIRRKQIKKFDKLCPTRPLRNRRSSISPFPPSLGHTIGSPISLRPHRPKPHLRSQQAFNKKTVVNLSQRPLSSTENKVLSLGMNFALPPKSIPVEDIIQSTEPALQHLNKTTADDVRIQLYQVLKQAKPPKTNISRQELAAIKNLRQDQSIHILPADKGNATVVMDKVDYDNKVTDILSTPTYRPLRKDPTPAIERRIASKLLALQRSEAISLPLYRQLRPSSSTCPRFFGQPKIHKPDIPLRPIVASRGGPTYNTAKHLTKILQPLVGNTPHHVSNSDQFVQHIQNLNLRPSDIMVSFDVVSLFTNVPTGEACLIAKERLTNDPTLCERTALSPDQIHDLLLTCVSSSSFRWRDKFFEQSTGTSMGSPLSPVLADMFMEEFETTALLSADHRPGTWLRYVDDTFIIWQHGPQHLQSFLDYLNDLHPSIKFTMEQEEGNSISFLDVKVHRHADGSLGHSVYRKPTHTDRYLHNSSFHHPSVKSSVTRTLVQRAHKICDQEHLQDELQHISTALHLNGYHRPQVKTKHPDCRVPYTQSQTQNYKATVNLPYLGNSSHKIQQILNQANIKVYHSSTKKLQASLQTHKDKQDHNTKAGVYRIPCECGKVYIGETGRDLSTRLKEHIAHGRRGDYDKSAIVKHSHEQDHIINWKAAELIVPVNRWHPRRIREAIEICRHNTVPQDIGFNISNIWRPLLPNQTNGSSIPTVHNPLSTTTMSIVTRITESTNSNPQDQDPSTS